MKDLEEGEDFAACVAWFACVEPLYNLIYANIDSSDKYGDFQISRVTIRTVLIKPLPFSAPYKAVQKPG